MIKKIFKRLIQTKPLFFIADYLNNKKLQRYEKKLKNNDTAKSTFETVYKKNIWGKDKLGNPSSGGGSHDLYVITPYIKIIKETIEKLNCKIIIDLGCGDFNIGKNFYDACDHYIACDISKHIININRKKFIKQNLEFRELNITEDNLPKGDLAFIRQVLQHLPNSDIQKLVNYLNVYKPYKYLIVTESIHTIEDTSINRNLDSNIYYAFKGVGVEIHKKPFDLKFSSMEKLLEVKLNDKHKTIIQTILYKF